MEDIGLEKENSDKREVLMMNIISSKADIIRDKKIKSNLHWGYFDRF
jgi:hypothetical protein